MIVCISKYMYDAHQLSYTDFPANRGLSGGEKMRDERYLMATNDILVM